MPLQGASAYEVLRLGLTQPMEAVVVSHVSTGQIIINDRRFQFVNGMGESDLTEDSPSFLCCFNGPHEGLAARIGDQWRFSTYRALLKRIKGEELYTPSLAHLSVHGSCALLGDQITLKAGRITLAQPPSRSFKGFFLTVVSKDGPVDIGVRLAGAAGTEVLTQPSINLKFYDADPVTMVGPWIQRRLPK